MSRQPFPPRIGLGGPALIVTLIISLIIFVIGLVVWWRVFSKAGYSGVLGLLMIVPLINVVLLLVLAFAKWPIQERLERYERLARTRQ
jgi:uncharacterized membrane protein